MRLQELDDGAWIAKQVFDYEQELYELRGAWWETEQVPQQLDLPLDEPPQPKKYNPF
jgi:hypothetical protein